MYICEKASGVSSVAAYDLIFPGVYTVSSGSTTNKKRRWCSLYGAAPEVSGADSICAWRLHCVVLTGGVQRRYGPEIKEAYKRNSNANVIT